METRQAASNDFRSELQSAKDFQSAKKPQNFESDPIQETDSSQPQNHDLSNQPQDLSDPVQKRRFWDGHLEQCRQSPLTQKAYCQQHDLKRHQFYYWKKRLASHHERGSFLPVALDLKSSGAVNPASQSGNVFAKDSSCAVRILTPNGIVIELEGPVNISELLSMAAKL